MDSKDTSIQASAAIDALRAGVVNRYIAEHLTFGRESEIAGIESQIFSNEEGSVQILLGGYGVGKSHLCEVLACRLEKAGYAVARVELGSSSERAENPDAVLQAIANSITVHIGGHHFHGSDELNSRLVEPFFQKESIKDEFYKLLLLFRPIPSAMTAANLAVGQVRYAAQFLHNLGCKGVVIIFDEAERATALSWTPYRSQQATNLILWFALTSANKDTSSLKHYRNERHYCSLPSSSLMHTIFCFTYYDDLVKQISSLINPPIYHLSKLNEFTLEKIKLKIQEIYQKAYGISAKISSQDEKKIYESVKDFEDTRTFVRCLVAALDHQRLQRV